MAVDRVGDLGVQGLGRDVVAREHALEDLGGRLAREESLARQQLVEHGAEAEEVAAAVGPQLHDHLGGHVGGLAGERLVAGAAPRGDAEVDELHRPLARHHDVARADVAVDDRRPLEDVLQRAADATRDEDRQLDVGDLAELAVAGEELDEAPAVDVLEDDAALAVDDLEVDDAADVLVVEHRITRGLLDEECDVGGVGDADLLDDDGALEAGLAATGAP